jgi:recombination protein RecT
MNNQLVTTKDFFNKKGVAKKFEELLGKKAPGFISSVLQVTSGNQYLAKADPATVYSAAMMAAVLDLPINNNLGLAYIVPYKNQAQFQMGYRGFIQLALRSGAYKSINVIDVYENQFISWNPLTEDLEIDFSKPEIGKVIGYASRFELNTGFIKTDYWTRDKVEAHGKRYSKSFEYKTAPWKTHFDEMARKTVLKSILNKYGLVSIELQKAVTADQAVIVDAENDTIDVDYVDGTTPEVIEPSIEEKKVAVDDNKATIKTNKADNSGSSKVNTP